MTTNTAVNAIKAPVMPHVACLSGQRTWRSSCHAPRKYDKGVPSMRTRRSFGLDDEAIFLAG